MPRGRALRLQYSGPKSWDQPLKFMTSAAAPPAPVLARMADYGIEVSHVYGLTEAYGTGVMCEWKEEWDAKSMEEKAALLARQGVRCLEPLDVSKCPVWQYGFMTNIS